VNRSWQDFTQVANIAFERFEDCCVLVQNHHSATDDEWKSWLDFVAQDSSAPPPNLRILIFSVGGSPTPKQRAQVHELMPKSGDGVRTAVVTASFVGRAIVTAMSLFNKNVRPFPMRPAKEAFAYVGIPESRHPELMALLRKMHERLGISFHAELG
jgi:hypothetical protein